MWFIQIKTVLIAKLIIVALLLTTNELGYFNRGLYFAWTWTLIFFLSIVGRLIASEEQKWYEVEILNTLIERIGSYVTKFVYSKTQNRILIINLRKSMFQFSLISYNDYDK